MSDTPKTDAAWDARARGAASLLYVRQEMEQLERENTKLREACFVFLEARKHAGYGMDEAEMAIRAAVVAA